MLASRKVSDEEREVHRIVSQTDGEVAHRKVVGILVLLKDSSAMLAPNFFIYLLGLSYCPTCRPPGK